MNFLLKVSVNYKWWLTALNIDGILVLCDQNMFSTRIRNRLGEGGCTNFLWSENHIVEWNNKSSQVVIFVKISRVLFSQCENKCTPENTKTLIHSRNKCHIQVKPLNIPHWKSWNTGFYPLNKNDIFHNVKITKMLFSQFENNKLLWRQIIEYPP